MARGVWTTESEFPSKKTSLSLAEEMGLSLIGLGRPSFFAVVGRSLIPVNDLKLLATERGTPHHFVHALNLWWRKCCIILMYVQDAYGRGRG